LKTNQDISPGDFPDPKKMKDYLNELDFALFKGLVSFQWPYNRLLSLPSPFSPLELIRLTPLCMTVGPKKGMMEALQQAVSEDIPRLLDQLPADPKVTNNLSPHCPHCATYDGVVRLPCTSPRFDLLCHILPYLSFSWKLFSIDTIFLLLLPG
jgi:hypothetical protein